MNNRTAIITGGAKRLGAAITRALHAHGLDVVVHCNASVKAATQLVEELNDNRPDSARVITADLRQTDSIEPLIDKAHAFNDRLDVLVNNASVYYPTPIQALTGSCWDDMMSINLKAPMLLSKAASEHLKVNHGCIINLTDIHADRPLKDYPVYSISKAGLVMQTQVLAKELAPDIRVNAISPGAILWPENMRADAQKEILDRTLLKKQGTPADVTNAVLYLIFNADYTTGQVLVMDGGRNQYS